MNSGNVVPWSFEIRLQLGTCSPTFHRRMRLEADAQAPLRRIACRLISNPISRRRDPNRYAVRQHHAGRQNVQPRHRPRPIRLLRKGHAEMPLPVRSSRRWRLRVQGRATRPVRPKPFASARPPKRPQGAPGNLSPCRLIFLLIPRIPDRGFAPSPGTPMMPIRKVASW